MLFLKILQFLAFFQARKAAHFDVTNLENVSLNNSEQINGKHSHMECVMMCQRKKKDAFYTNDGKCFCVSEVTSDNNNVDGVSGKLSSPVSSPNVLL